jgi:hypothetical protein
VVVVVGRGAASAGVTLLPKNVAAVASKAIIFLGALEIECLEIISSSK